MRHCGFLTALTSVVQSRWCDTHHCCTIKVVSIVATLRYIALQLRHRSVVVLAVHSVVSRYCQTAAQQCCSKAACPTVGAGVPKQAERSQPTMLFLVHTSLSTHFVSFYSSLYVYSTQYPYSASNVEYVKVSLSLTGKVRDKLPLSSTSFLVNSREH